MPLHRRAALVGALAALSIPAACSSAGAVTLSPTGSYTLSSANPVIAFPSTRQQITCAGMSITASFDAAGNGTAPAGAASFTRCSTPLLGQMTLAQNRDWTIVVTRGGTSTIFRITVPSSGWRFAAASGGCAFFTSGSLTLTEATRSGSLLTTTPIPITASSLTNASVSGCSPALTSNGLAATFSGTFNLNRAVTITP